MDSLAIFHVAEPSGAARSLRARLEWLAEQGRLTIAFPGPGAAADSYGDLARIVRLPYSAVTLPGGPAGLPDAALRLRREGRMFRAYLRRERPDLVLCVSAMLPAALVAARLEGVPTIVHAAEVLAGDPSRRATARVAGWALARGTRRLAGGIAACSEAVAGEYLPPPPEVVITAPPIEDCGGAGGRAFRSEFGIDPEAPLVVAVGSISRRRGQDILVRAMKIIVRAFPQARCVIVGGTFPGPRIWPTAISSRG